MFHFIKRETNKSDQQVFSDKQIVAMADGEQIDVATVSDEVFAKSIIGPSIAFHYPANSVTLCSPANGTLALLFPTGHAFGIATADGVEILVHCGIDTVDAKGDGFELLGKKQTDSVKAGDPIVRVNLKKLSKHYDMSTILIISNSNGHTVHFRSQNTVKKGDVIGTIE